MAQFSISPSVDIKEFDQTSNIPSVSTSIGAFAGAFEWGPALTRVNVDSENTLIRVFGRPNNSNFVDWLVASNYLGYSRNAKYVRVIGSAAKNAVHTGTPILIRNDDEFESDPVAALSNKLVARYPGSLGNSLQVSVCDSSGFDTWKYRGYFTQSRTAKTTTKSVSETFIGNLTTNSDLITNVSDTSKLFVGMTVDDAGANIQANTTIVEIVNSSVVRVSKVALGTISNENFTATANVVITAFPGQPTTTNYVADKGGSNDEMHIVVIDFDGKFTGTPGTLLEKFEGVSKAVDAVATDGTSNFFVDVINRGSRYVYITEPELLYVGQPDSTTTFADLATVVSKSVTTTTSSTNVTAASTADLVVGMEITGANFNAGTFIVSITNATTFVVSAAAIGSSTFTATATLYDTAETYEFSGGVDTYSLTDAERLAGFALFRNPEEVDVNLVFGGDCSENIADYLIDDIGEYRKDCMVFVSPPKAAVVNNPGQELESIKDFRNKVNASSYAVMDTGWKYQYDRYNDKYRWVPLNADIAGLVAMTELTNDAWWSPAGYNRGYIKNVVKLAWNPAAKADRDDLYQLGINPVVTFPGVGTILYGDKTLLAKPSAFDRINVRRLFIILEKAIATYAKFILFEFNDSITRSRFTNTVIPYLRNIQGRRGIIDFKVLADETVNTPDIIDSNAFVANIMIKPSRSINFIELRFTAMNTGASFEEITTAGQ